ncbi:hypothetical protein OB955_08085 [Halobacteria archaeon AArc-m2/3/4]|uniref:Uncharacterized protein n=1 Tax=Natronoglomus mannanivorans TaxID=2979990 RepID=A0AAP2YX91_9EURY|nr:hypothetical protein [Halobacteria archaeon AArc-xg1-1]MCU4972696.1 hypothetical protein [Halobacteria archaeon AArc-m2/3/4]
MGNQETWPSVGRAIVAVALVLLVSRLALDVAGVTSVSEPVWPLAVLSGFVLVVAFLVSTRSPDESGGDANTGKTASSGIDDGETDDTNSVWNAIPSWQYGGRHAESGGLTRDEQEQALAEIQEQAAELERENDVQNRR